jgi:hypothetical protein
MYARGKSDDRVVPEKPPNKVSVAKLIDVKFAIPERDHRGRQENSPRRA